MAAAAPISSKPHERQTIVVNSTLTIVVLIFAFYILYNFVPIPVPPLPNMIDRLVYALRLQSFSCMCLVTAVLITAMTRFFTIAIDPINGKGEHLVAFKVRFLTNTLEQFIISLTGQLILATYLTEAQMKVIPILVTFFVIGRILFYVGYSRSYLKRSAGFVATFGVNSVVWCFVMYKVITDFFL